MAFKKVVHRVTVMDEAGAAVFVENPARAFALRR
jgi:hypothetical protein